MSSSSSSSYVQSPNTNSQLPSIVVNCDFTSIHRRIDLQTGRILFSSSPSAIVHHQRHFHPRLLFSPDLFCANLSQFLSCSPDLDHQQRVSLAEAIGCFIVSELPTPLFQVDAFIQIVRSEFVDPTRRQRRPSFQMVDGTYIIDAAVFSHEKEPRLAVEQFNEECSICFENYGKDRKAVKIECNHVFHTNCIYKWLLTNNTCPLCRKRALLV